jgi:hypothetical protein
MCRQAAGAQYAVRSSNGGELQQRSGEHGRWVVGRLRRNSRVLQSESVMTFHEDPAQLKKFMARWALQARIVGVAFPHQ